MSPLPHFDDDSNEILGPDGSEGVKPEHRSPPPFARRRGEATGHANPNRAYGPQSKMVTTKRRSPVGVGTTRSRRPVAGRRSRTTYRTEESTHNRAAGPIIAIGIVILIVAGGIYLKESGGRHSGRSQAAGQENGGTTASKDGEDVVRQAAKKLAPEIAGDMGINEVQAARLVECLVKRNGVERADIILDEVRAVARVSDPGLGRALFADDETFKLHVTSRTMQGDYERQEINAIFAARAALRE